MSDDINSLLYIQDRALGDSIPIASCIENESDLRMYHEWINPHIYGIKTVPIDHYNATQARLQIAGQTVALKHYTPNSPIWTSVEFDQDACLYKADCSFSGARSGTADGTSSKIFGVQGYPEYYVSTQHCEANSVADGNCSGGVKYNFKRWLLKFDFSEFIGGSDIVVTDAQIHPYLHYGVAPKNNYHWYTPYNGSRAQLIGLDGDDYLSVNDWGSIQYIPFLPSDIVYNKYSGYGTDGDQPGNFHLNQAGLDHINLALNDDGIVHLAFIDAEYDLTAIHPPAPEHSRAVFFDEGYISLGIHVAGLVPTSAPNDLAIVNEGGYSKCTWTIVNNEYYYEVQRSVSTSPSNYTIIGITSSDSLLDNVLYSEGRWYRVRSVNHNGRSDWSDAAPCW